ncbi:DNA alkylation repair protein [bacterium (Candidatus Howlettbacteria) CG_4_10_14_0_8_um_filter_40_9]|nr:MAG: DNA alkylation repair protein [bacterium (Candidatus Howlettbacteria) CG_4_10_14_0_8_um_filter_40_9]
MVLQELKKNLYKTADPERAVNFRRFFKTGKGEYGEGDQFIGITVPEIRKVAKKHKDLEIDELTELLKSPIHEERMTALIIMAMKYPKDEENIYNLYIKNTKYINNWDLVDVTCPRIVGAHLLDKPRDILYDFASSNDIWEKRIAIISTAMFIRNNDFSDTLNISEILLNDTHDLIHKSVGWMLREVGNRDMGVEEGFLKKHYKEMPRTMLRYAIEKFPEEKRQRYLKGNI